LSAKPDWQDPGDQVTGRVASTPHLIKIPWSLAIFSSKTSGRAGLELRRDKPLLLSEKRENIKYRE
jgi:hypothetical protein